MRPLSSSTIERQIPCWDRHRATLFYSSCVIKVFKQPAAIQMLILDVFEEEEWPPRIDDPLIPHDGMSEEDIKKRLHSEIENLNRGQKGGVRIRFKGDGTGHGVSWGIG